MYSIIITRICELDMNNQGFWQFFAKLFRGILVRIASFGGGAADFCISCV